MSDQDYYRQRAEVERAAAMAATDMAAVRAHLALAREYDWLAATEPYADAADHQKHSSSRGMISAQMAPRHGIFGRGASD